MASVGSCEVSRIFQPGSALWRMCSTEMIHSLQCIPPNCYTSQPNRWRLRRSTSKSWFCTWLLQQSCFVWWCLVDLRNRTNLYVNIAHTVDLMQENPVLDLTFGWLTHMSYGVHWSLFACCWTDAFCCLRCHACLAATGEWRQVQEVLLMLFGMLLFWYTQPSCITHLLHPATPRWFRGNQAFMPTPWGCWLPPSHEGGGGWSMVSDGVGGYHGRAEPGLLCHCHVVFFMAKIEIHWLMVILMSLYVVVIMKCIKTAVIDSIPSNIE